MPLALELPPTGAFQAYVITQFCFPQAAGVEMLHWASPLSDMLARSPVLKYARSVPSFMRATEAIWKMGTRCCILYGEVPESSPLYWRNDRAQRQLSTRPLVVFTCPGSLKRIVQTWPPRSPITAVSKYPLL